MPQSRPVPVRMLTGIVDFTSFLGEIWCAAAKKLLLFFFGLVRWPLLFLWRLMLFAGRSLGASLRGSLGDNRYFSGRIFRAVKTLTVTLFSSPKNLPALSGYYAKRARLRYRQPAQVLILLLLPLAAGAMLAVTVHHYGDLRLGLQVAAGETVLGCVTDENDFLTAKKEAEALLVPHGGETQWPEIRYSLRLITANAFTDADTLKERLLQTARTKTVPACGVFIDGDFLCAVKNENDAKAVFTDLLYENAPSDAATVGFTQRITYAEGAYPDADDTLWTKERLRSYLSALQGAQALHVTVTHTETKTVDVPYSTVEIPSDALYIGTSRVVVSGHEGADQVTSLVTLLDGEPIRSQELLRYKLRDPVDEHVQVGTRALDASFVQSTSYGGVLIWPAIGATHLNSDYEWRWGRLHAAIDIGTSGAGSSLGKLVVAAAEGTVVVAGVHSSYGYYVKIDHGNGMQTLYAHCMEGSLMVSAGDHVDAGAPIARVGMTGFATGPHLHFEVIINGNKVDPKPYLGIG